MSREQILSALRAGLAAAPVVLPEAPARPASVPVGPDAWAVLAEILAPLEVRLRLTATPAEAASHVADIARERGPASYTRWQELPASAEIDEALKALARIEVHGGRCCQAPARADLGLAFAHAALLDSGSLALVAGPGRQRSASLLPPTSVILVPRAALLPDVSALPELLRHHADASGMLPACLNLVTGPSSTADIELVLVRGVHGPGALEVVGLNWNEEGE